MNNSFGFTQADISPTKHNSGSFVDLWGFGPKGRNPDDKMAHHIDINAVSPMSLLCQSVCLRDHYGKPLLIISVDLGAISDEIVQIIKSEISRLSQNELSQENICINVSHTHGAPVMVNMPGWQDGVNTANQDYVEFVVKEIIQSGISSFNKQAAPVDIYSHKGVSEIGSHRRTTREDMHDDSLNVLALQDTEGQVLGILTNAACHPVTMRREVSSDFIGTFRENIKKKYPNTFSMFLQGFSATSNPNNLLGDFHGESAQRAFMHKIGNTLSQEVTSLLEHSNSGQKVNSEDTSYQIKHGQAPLLNQQNFSPHNPLFSQVPYKGWLEKHDTLSTELPVAQQLIRLGHLDNGNPLHMVASSGEVDGGISNELRGMFGDDSMMLGYSNGVAGYMVRGEGPNDQSFPFADPKGSLNYETAHSHVWYGNTGPLKEGWHQEYIINYQGLKDTS